MMQLKSTSSRVSRGTEDGFYASEELIIHDSVSVENKRRDAKRSYLQMSWHLIVELGSRSQLAGIAQMSSQHRALHILWNDPNASYITAQSSQNDRRWRGHIWFERNRNGRY